MPSPPREDERAKEGEEQIEPQQEVVDIGEEDEEGGSDGGESEAQSRGDVDEHRKAPPQEYIVRAEPGGDEGGIRMMVPGEGEAGL